MRLAFTGAARHVERPVRSIACLAFVGLLGAACWTGAVFIAEKLLHAAPLY